MVKEVLLMSAPGARTSKLAMRGSGVRERAGGRAGFAVRGSERTGVSGTIGKSRRSVLGPQHPHDGGGDASPLALLFHQLLPPLPGQGIEAGLAIVLRRP